MDWCGTCIVPLYKGKGNKYERIYSSGISLLSVVDKQYGRVLIKAVSAGTEGAIGEKQYGFTQGRGYMGQVFAVRQTEMGKNYNGKLLITFANNELLL